MQNVFRNLSAFMRRAEIQISASVKLARDIYQRWLFVALRRYHSPLTPPRRLTSPTFNIIFSSVRVPSVIRACTDKGDREYRNDDVHLLCRENQKIDVHAIARYRMNGWRAEIILDRKL